MSATALLLVLIFSQWFCTRALCFNGPFPGKTGLALYLLLPFILSLQSSLC